MSEQLPSETRVWWTINVTGYGSFQHFGTEAEAEEMRSHKAQWEGGVGTKRHATPTEAMEGYEHLKWMRDAEYPLDERELEALR